jgi:hypothetical protein
MSTTSCPSRRTPQKALEALERYHGRSTVDNCLDSPSDLSKQCHINRTSSKYQELLCQELDTLPGMRRTNIDIPMYREEYTDNGPCARLYLCTKGLLRTFDVRLVERTQFCHVRRSPLSHTPTACQASSMFYIARARTKNPSLCL